MEIDIGEPVAVLVAENADRNQGWLRRFAGCDEAVAEFGVVARNHQNVDQNAAQGAERLACSFWQEHPYRKLVKVLHCMSSCTVVSDR